MALTYQEQIDRFAVELADESIQRKKDPKYKESFTDFSIASSISKIYDVEYGKVLSDLGTKKNIILNRESRKK